MQKKKRDLLTTWLLCDFDPRTSMFGTYLGLRGNLMVYASGRSIVSRLGRLDRCYQGEPK